ncbi:ead/Ea22-like family protein [Salmonella enterica subsp. enterica]|nr:ead/Ea22-like family protein [Salmonella enterica subsp. enterica]
MNIDKQALRERYSPKPAPECHICGAEMTIQRMSASRITYGCTGATYDDKGCHYADGRSIADDHYEQSRVTVVDVSDPDVLALLDELEHYKSREERVTKLVLDNLASWDALYKKVEAAEKRIAEQREYYEGVIADGSKRIAELEEKLANPVLLPKTNGYWNEQEKAYEEAITLAKRQVRLAGFSVEDM